MRRGREARTDASLSSPRLQLQVLQRLGWIPLKPGFNVVVGENNCGKSTLLQGMSLQFTNTPHRTLATVPARGREPETNARVDVTMVLGAEELQAALERMPQFAVEAWRDGTKRLGLALNHSLATGGLDFTTVNNAGSAKAGHCFSDERHLDPRQFLSFGYDVATKRVATGDAPSASPTAKVLWHHLSNLYRERLYYFKPERLNLGHGKAGPSLVLAPNASNLPEVLHQQSSTNPSRWERYNRLVQRVLPRVRRVATRVMNQDGQLRVELWTHDPATERDDLNVPLSESGSGVGQVLGMLYVLTTAEQPCPILIDEPQSFLHPGAIRRLFEVFHEHPQHQYIVATHSPAVINAAQRPHVVVVTTSEGVSHCRTVDSGTAEGQRLFLSEVGARISDVFGADNVLWVEGDTEEECFPIIARDILNVPLNATAIVAVRQTGDLDGKLAKTAFEIYHALSNSTGLIPPAVGFVFDREGKSDTEINNAKERGRDRERNVDRVQFLTRRMYENYLLVPEAVAALIAGSVGFDGVTEQDVRRWWNDNQWSPRFFKKVPAIGQQTPEIWTADVHGGKFLEALFSELSEQRVTYRKVQHGKALTEWLVANNPDALSEVASLVRPLLSP